MLFIDKLKNFFKKSQLSATIVLEDRIEYDAEKQMHLIPAGEWKPNLTLDEIKAFPMINEPMSVMSDAGVFITPYGVAPPVNYDILWTYFKYTPEMVAVIRAIVEDIMSDGWELDGGRNNKKAAEEFLMKNYAKEQISSLLFDTMVTGDGYFYVQKLSKTVVKSFIDNVLNRDEFKSLIADEKKSEYSNDIFKAVQDDEDIFSPRGFISVPSSTLRAQFDKNGDVRQWIQKVGTKVKNFNPEEIIHFRLMRLDGKFYGFSPMASILKEMDILANVKDLARYIFEKGGVPNFMFILKNETPKSENFKQFKKSLQLYSSLANKYKNLVVTGEVEAKELNKWGKDMEFRELAKYLTQVLIMTWGVPTSRLSDVGLGDRIASRGSTISTEGYYRKISHIQDLLEDLINNELLAPFKVKMRFNKTYAQDEIRDAQIDKIKTDTVEQRIALGLFDRETAAKYIGVSPEELPSEEEWDKARAKLMPKQGWGSGQQGTDKMSDFQLLNQSTEKIGEAADKQGAALENMKSEIEELHDRIDELEDKKS